jgi:hypothetical protein
MLGLGILVLTAGADTNPPVETASEITAEPGPDAAAAEGHATPAPRSELEQRAREVFTDDVQAFLKQEMPQVMAFMEARWDEAENDPLMREELMRGAIELADIARDLYEARREAPEVYATFRDHKVAEVRSGMLAWRIKRTDDDQEREQLKRQLRQVLERGFDLSQELREYEARAIERELARVWETLEKRREHRETIIDRRYQELVHDEDPYEW